MLSITSDLVCTHTLVIMPCLIIRSGDWLVPVDSSAHQLCFELLLPLDQLYGLEQTLPLEIAIDGTIHRQSRSCNSDRLINHACSRGRIGRIPSLCTYEECVRGDIGNTLLPPGQRRDSSSTDKQPQNCESGSHHWQMELRDLGQTNSPPSPKRRLDMTFQPLCKVSTMLWRQLQNIPVERVAIEIHDSVSTWPFQALLPNAAVPTSRKVFFGNQSVDER